MDFLLVLEKAFSPEPKRDGITSFTDFTELVTLRQFGLCCGFWTLFVEIQLIVDRFKKFKNFSRGFR